VTQVVCATLSKTCLLPQLGQINAFNTKQDVSWYLKTKHDTGATHHTQMMIPAIHSTLHVMLFVRHIAAHPHLKSVALGWVSHLKQIPEPCHLLTVSPCLTVPLLLQLLHDLGMLLCLALKPGLCLC